MIMFDYVSKLSKDRWGHHFFTKERYVSNKKNTLMIVSHDEEFSGEAITSKELGLSKEVVYQQLIGNFYITNSTAIFEIKENGKHMLLIDKWGYGTIGKELQKIDNVLYTFRTFSQLLKIGYDFAVVSLKCYKTK